jgi:YgiT-type zinc finger domain-containing protein
MVDKCYFCKGKVRMELVTIDYRWGNRLFVIEGVPAGVCRQCGEKYLESGVYRELERLVTTEEQPRTRATVDILSFEESSAA